jgi:hypothetical protein
MYVDPPTAWIVPAFANVYGPMVLVPMTWALFSWSVPAVMTEAPADPGAREMIADVTRRVAFGESRSRLLIVSLDPRVTV